MRLSLPALLILARIATAQVALLRIQVMEGEGAVYALGARVSRPLTVLISDETGKPVAGASVSFHLPEEGPGGTFGNGLRTDVATTDSNGHANPHAMQVNRTPGRFQIRVVAAKEQARVGAVTFQYIADAKTAGAPDSSPRRTPIVTSGKLKWVVVAALAGGAAVAGALIGGHGGSQAAAPTATTSIPISIGIPTITVGKP